MTLTLGTVGRDVPLEVLDAAGARVVRLRGRAGTDLAPADAYLGTGVDPAVRALLAGLLESGFAGLDGIVVGSDTDASRRLYYLLRELRRVDPAAGVPPVHLVDVLHLPRETSRRYTLAKVRELRTVVESWTGTTITDDALRDAAARRDAARLAARDLLAHRRSDPARLSGARFLDALLAGDTLDPDAHAALLRAVEPGDPLPGRRVLLTGSGHDDSRVTAAIEAAGAVVVADDHPDGELGLESLAGAGGADPLAAIAARWHADGPTPQRASTPLRAAATAARARAAGAELIVAYVRERDDAPLWEATAQSRAAGIPVVLLTRQRYGEVDIPALEEAL